MKFASPLVFKAIALSICFFCVSSQAIPNPVNDCAKALTQIETSNSPTLFANAETCALEGDDLAAVQLMIVGQIRGMVDMMLLSPKDQSGKEAAAKLYQAIFYRYGGLGDDAIYSTALLTERLITRIDSWSPEFAANYNPGWEFRLSDRHSFYKLVAREQIDKRLYAIKRRSTLLADQRYASLSRELTALHKKTHGRYEVGSEDYQSHQNLEQQRRALEAEILTTFPKPSTKRSVLDGLPPEVAPDIRNLISGINGPSAYGNKVFVDDSSVRDSWIARVLSSSELEELLRELDFRKEVLVAAWIGRQEAGTGSILITDATYIQSLQSGWSLKVRVGVRSSTCDRIDKSVSHPFALAAVKKMSASENVVSWSRSNFADGCHSAAAAPAFKQ